MVLVDVFFCFLNPNIIPKGILSYVVKSVNPIEKKLLKTVYPRVKNAYFRPLNQYNFFNEKNVDNLGDKLMIA